MDKKGIRAVPMFSNQYPALLKHIYDPPPTLYCKGDIGLLNHSRTIGVIGSRTPTFYGESVAQKISSELAKTVSA